MNGKCLNPPRVHDFDEEFRKESQFCCISQEGFSRDVRGLRSCTIRLTRRVLGTCALGKAWGSLCSAACARRVVSMCALENAWGSLRSPPALEGCLV